MNKLPQQKKITISPIPGLTVSASTDWMIKQMTSEFDNRQNGCKYDDGLTPVSVLANEANKQAKKHV